MNWLRWQLTRWVLQNPDNRAVPLAAGTKCCHCGQPATEQWWPSVCALRGEKLDWMPVCAACDYTMNEHTVRFLFGNTKDHRLAEYRALALRDHP